MVILRTLWGDIGHLFLIVTAAFLYQFFSSTVQAYPMPYVSPSTGISPFANGPLRLIANRRSVSSEISTLVSGNKKPTVLRPKYDKDNPKKTSEKISNRLLEGGKSRGKRPAVGNTFKQDWSTKVREWVKQGKTG
ncbi:hypothetical protein IWQ61_010322 [Dispira simplex]|nr:hypothetical protein IWQ61_010322 [Dispira simplex]